MARNRTNPTIFSTNRIKAVRDQMGLNLEQLSELSGISMSHLNRLENGTRRASVDLIDKIAAALKVPRGKLLDTGTRTETITVKHRLQPLEKSEMPTEEWTDVSLPTMPPYTDVEKHAGIVRGPCMEAYYPEGTVLVWVDVDTKAEPMISGRRYIVQRGDELTVRSFVRERNGGEWLTYESSHPDCQETLNLGAMEGSGARVAGRVIQSVTFE